MKKALYIIGIALALCVARTQAQSVKGVTMQRGENYVSVDFDLDLTDLKVKSNRALLLTPIIVNQGDTIKELPSIGIYGRNRYYHYLRNGQNTITGPDDIMFRYKEQPDTLHYHAMPVYDPRMEGSQLLLLQNIYGCCDGLRPGEAQEALLVDGFFTPKPAAVEMWMPQLTYIRPEAEAHKERALSGQAFVDFPVNRTEIHPDYRNNVHELMKITATIDSIRLDKDIEAKLITLKGYASPEGNYQNNVRLAKGRTEALRQYVQELYRFPEGFMQTDYEPEDWQGLRRYVAAHDELPNRDAILQLIDSDLQPDPKDNAIKAQYPQQYAFLLKEVYPALRHTDYTIQYTVRSYTNIDEIRDIMRTAPQKLSLNEMYLLAQTYEAGSDEFREVFETAVRMYPDDPTANLNAANTALARQDLKAAEQYLQKAGQTPEATYTRGVLRLLQKDKAAAKQLIQQAAQQGLPVANETLEEMAKRP